MGVNAMMLRAGIESASAEAIKALRSIAKPIKAKKKSAKLQLFLPNPKKLETLLLTQLKKSR